MMKITVLGTGIVGQTVASKMVQLGHEVVMGTREPEATLASKKVNQMTGVAFPDWHSKHQAVQLLPFEKSAVSADLVINATSGMASLSILETVGEANLNGKVLIDIANPLDFSNGFPPSLNPVNTDSLGEQIQAKFPEVKVVKTLNTMNTFIMMNPASIPGDHSVFVSGNDAKAKAIISDLLQSIGWAKHNIFDLGDITTARGTEMLLPVWLRLYGSLGHANFNFHIQLGK